MKKKSATKRKYTRKAHVPAAFTPREPQKIFPNFMPPFCVPDRCVAADSSGTLWVIDPKKGTITPIKVKS